MEYRLPKIKDEQILKEYIEEHYANGETSISASLNLPNMDFKEWVDKVNRHTEVADDEWGKYYLYLVFDNNKLIGLLNIRFDLSDELRDKYGDIGYGVRPSERKKGYATKMLDYALDICKEKNMKYVILGCYEDNYGSSKAIVKNGGILYRKVPSNNKNSNYYKIKL